MKINNKIIRLKRFAKSIFYCERSAAILLAMTIILSLFLVAVPMAGIADAATLEVGPGQTYTTIQAAIDAANPGDTINVADDTYTITSKIIVNEEVTITGNIGNPENVVVQYSPAANSLMFDMRASNVTIQGIKTTGGKTGFWFDQSGVTGCTISHCIVDTVKEYGIYMKNGGSGHTIDSCTISNTGQTYTGAPAVLVENCLDITFSNNTLSSISDKGVYVRVCNAGSIADRVEVTGNSISGCAYSGIQVYQSPYTYIYNNTISSTSDKGINIIGPNASSQAARVVVEGNSISGCPWGGILLTHDRYTYIYNNTIFSTGDKGISIANGENVTSSAERIIVEGNDVSGTKYPGIQVAYAVPYTYIYNNTLSGCNYYGADSSGDWDYASIHVAEDCENTIVDSNDVSDGINGIQIWADNCTVTNNTIYDMGSTYTETKGTGDGIYYNSGIIIGTNWLTNNFKPTGTTITDNNIRDNYWGLYVRDYATLSSGDSSVLSVTAEENWWGDASGPGEFGPGTGDKVSDNVDYDPWYTDEGKTTLSNAIAEVWVDDNYTDGNCDGHTWGSDAFKNIQDGINGVDEGGTVNVAAGTYDEQLSIDGNDLTIQAISTPVITGVVDADYIIKVTNADVTLDGLTVDGTGNNIKYGIWYYDDGSGTTSGAITNCTVEYIERAEGKDIRIENSPVDITNNTIKEFAKDGIFVRDSLSTGTISGNEIILRTIDGVNEVQYGVQVGWGADVTIQNNTIYDSTIASVGIYEWNWSSSGIFVLDSTAGSGGSSADIFNNHIHHCMEGVHIGYQGVSGDTSYGLIRDNNIHDCFWCVGVVGDASADIENNTIEMLDADVIAFVEGYGEGIFVGGSWTDVHEYPTATISNNTIDNFDMGIDIYEFADVTINGNTITNNDDGIKTNADASEGWSQNVAVHSNSIIGNSEYGIDNTENTGTVDATNNWWGDASGPGEVGLGTGDKVSNNVDYDPWYTDAAMSSLSNETEIISYKFEAANNTALIADVIGAINSTDHTIALTVPYGTDVTALIATFDLSTGATAKVGETAQVSETTPNDFSSPVTYTITSLDETGTQDWTVTVTLAAASNVATLSNLTINGTTITGFSPSTLTYNKVLPYGTIEVPEVAATPTDSNASKVITQAVNVTGTEAQRTAKVVVTAEDGSTTKTYKVIFSVAANTEATLSNLTVDGTTITGFDPATLIYNKVLPYGTTEVPAVGATPTDPNATKVITQAANLTGTEAQRTAKVVVTAEDGSTTKTYKVIFGSIKVTITKTGPTIANQGNNITYTITYKNAGTFNATNVVITETYPSEVSYVSATPAPNIGNNQWSIGTLAPGVEGTITVKVHIK